MRDMKIVILDTIAYSFTMLTHWTLANLFPLPQAKSEIDFIDKSLQRRLTYILWPVSYHDIIFCVKYNTIISRHFTWFSLP